MMTVGKGIVFVIKLLCKVVLMLLYGFFKLVGVLSLRVADLCFVFVQAMKTEI